MPGIPIIGAPEMFDLELPGARGHFAGLAPRGASLPRIDYLQTSVCLDPHHQGSRLLNYLKPVREQFSPTDLQLDGLMQRDIDDARVAFELIPYLMDSPMGFRFFPPIVVLAMPLDPLSGLPRSGYGVRSESTAQQEGYVEVSTQFGAGNDAELRIRHPEDDENFGASMSDAVRLGLNTQRVSLVILDGQHRAMALIALWRNLRDGGWSNDRAAPFRRYYEHWTKGYIEGLDLSQVMLPVCICWIPGLQEDAAVDGGVDGSMTAAARKLFLALNKNARPVSDARNKLLDDEDLIAGFMRATIQQMIDGGAAIQPWAIDLDPKKDRVRLAGDLPITGVTHLYQVVDEVLWHGQPIRSVALRRFPRGVRPRDAFESQVLGKLQASTFMTQDEIREVSPSNFTHSQEDALTESFSDRYGRVITLMFSAFSPFALHGEAYTARAAALRQDPAGARLSEIIFTGQGLSEVFQDVTSRLKGLSRDKHPGVVPSYEVVDETLQSLSEDAAYMTKVIDEGAATRRALMFERSDFNPGAGSAGRSAIDKVFEMARTTAFQVGLAGAFFCTVDEYEVTSRKTFSPAERMALARGYVDDLNAFFVPDSVAGLCGLVDVFFGGRTATNLSEADPTLSDRRFEKLFIAGELQPAKWPSFAALLMEIWRPESAEGATGGKWYSLFREARLACRNSVLVQALSSRVQQKAHEEGVAKANLDDAVLNELAADVAAGLLAILSHTDSLEDGDAAMIEGQAREAAFQAARGAESAVVDDDAPSDSPD